MVTFEDWTWALTFIVCDWLLCSRGLFPTAGWISDINEKDDLNTSQNEWDPIIWVTIFFYSRQGLKYIELINPWETNNLMFSEQLYLLVVIIFELQWATIFVSFSRYMSLSIKSYGSCTTQSRNKFMKHFSEVHACCIIPIPYLYLLQNIWNCQHEGQKITTLSLFLC